MNLSAFDALVLRLGNWGRWGRIDDGGPDRCCVSSIWQNWIPRLGWDEGWGAEESSGSPDRLPIDDSDAEVIDGWVRQLSMSPKRILVRRFVVGLKTDWREVDPAIRSLLDLMAENRRVVDRMERAHG